MSLFQQFSNDDGEQYENGDMSCERSMWTPQSSLLTILVSVVSPLFRMQLKKERTFTDEVKWQFSTNIGVEMDTHQDGLHETC